MTKRILTFSDIHGQLDKLNKLLKIINYNPKEDLLIGLGDYVDRGIQNVELLYEIKKLKEQGAIFLRGNHDHLTLGTISELLNKNSTVKIIMHKQCGGYNTYKELKKLNNKQLK
ncbi:MAG: metallophosphoesterase, partial [archaeon]